MQPSNSNMPKKPQSNTIAAKTGQMNTSSKSSFDSGFDSSEDKSYSQADSKSDFSSQSVKAGSGKSEIAGGQDRDSSGSSLASMVKSQLPAEAKENFELASKQFSGFMKEAKTYINESPREAAVVGVALALGAWVMLRTSPGKKAFNAASTAFMPRLKEWMDQTFGSSQNAVH